MKAEGTRRRSRAGSPASAGSKRAAKKSGAGTRSRSVVIETLYDVDWINEFPLESSVTKPGRKRGRRRKLSILRIEPLSFRTPQAPPAPEASSNTAIEQQSRGLEERADKQVADEWRAVLSASTSALSASSAALTRLRLRATARAKADAVACGHRVSQLAAAAADSYHRADLGRRTTAMRQHAGTIKGWFGVPVVAAMTALILAVTTASSSAPELRPGYVGKGDADSRAASIEIVAALGHDQNLPSESDQADAPAMPSVEPAEPVRLEEPARDESARRGEPIRRDEPAHRDEPARRSEQARRDAYVGGLFVQSDPPAAVFVNHTYMGETPITLTNLRAGSHVVWLDRDGFDRWSGAVSVVANGVTRLDPKLQRSAARANQESGAPAP